MNSAYIDELLGLIRDLSNTLALEYALVDNEDLPTIGEGIDLLTRASRVVERSGSESPRSIGLLLHRCAQPR